MPLPFKRSPAVSSEKEVVSSSQKEVAVPAGIEAPPPSDEKEVVVPADKIPVDTEASSSAAATPTTLNTTNSLAFTLPEVSYLKVYRLSRYYKRGDYLVEDGNGKTYLKSGKKNWSYKRDLTDAEGRLIYKLEMNRWRLPMVYYIRSANDETLVTIKGIWSVSKMQADVHFTNFEGSAQTLFFCASNWTNDRFELKLGDKLVAEVRKTYWDRRSFKRQWYSQGYDVRVEPGVDRVMMAGMVMALDECVLLTEGHAANAAVAGTIVGAAAGGGAGL